MSGPKELKQKKKKKRRNERAAARDACGRYLALRKRERGSPIPPSLSPSVRVVPLVILYQRRDSRGRNERRIVCLERPFKTPLRPFVILARSRGTAPYREEDRSWKRVRAVRLLNVTRRLSRSYEGGREESTPESSHASFEFGKEFMALGHKINKDDV